MRNSEYTILAASPTSPPRITPGSPPWYDHLSFYFIPTFLLALIIWIKARQFLRGVNLTSDSCNQYLEYYRMYLRASNVASIAQGMLPPLPLLYFSPLSPPFHLATSRLSRPPHSSLRSAVRLLIFVCRVVWDPCPSSMNAGVMNARREHSRRRD